MYSSTCSTISDHDASKALHHSKQTGLPLWLCPAAAEEWIDDGVDIVVPSELDRADRSQWMLFLDEMGERVSSSHHSRISSRPAAAAAHSASCICKPSIVSLPTHARSSQRKSPLSDNSSLSLGVFIFPWKRQKDTFASGHSRS
jgi:hypothetical protein